MELYTSDSSDTDSREQKTLDYGRMNMISITFDEKKFKTKDQKSIETMLLNHNRLSAVPHDIYKFTNLKVLDLSSNCLTKLPDALFHIPLITLVVKNNLLTNKSLPKSFITQNTNTLKELNFSGNLLTHFPDQILELRHLKYLYIGGNKIHRIPKDIRKIQSLQILSIGGNSISEVPETVGHLHHLQALILCENSIEHLPSSIARLKNLKSLLLHKNRLRHLPKDIIALKNLTELSLRDNPLVVRFVQDMALKPPTLMELAARVVKSDTRRYGREDLPKTVLEYLNSANCCVNPKCKGVYFDNRVEHIKFVDFCGKYRVPLLQYLCSSKCIEPEIRISSEQPGPSGYMMKKVLLG